MSTDDIDPPQEWMPAKDISGLALALGLLILFLVFELALGLPRLLNTTSDLLAVELGVFAAPVLLGWAVAAILEAIARRRRTQRTAWRRNTLIASAVFAVFVVIGSRASPPEPATEDQLADLASEPPESAPAQTPRPSLVPPEPQPPAPTTRPLPAAPPVAAQPVEKPAPWASINSRPEYVEATAAERLAIRDVYWRICIERLIPPDQRQAGYGEFLREIEILDVDAPPAPSRPMSVWEYREQQRDGVRSPVDDPTMARWCWR